MVTHLEEGPDRGHGLVSKHFARPEGRVALTDAAATDVSRPRREATLQWLHSHPALACLAVAVTASGAIQLAIGSHLVLFGDEWSLVLERRGVSAGAFFDPHVGHLIAGLVAVYKLLLATFGMSSPVPYHLVSTLVYLLAAVLLFVYARRRVGDWLALLGTAVILFFGASTADMIWPFQMFFSGAIAAGIASLLALDRDDQLGDVLACALLLVSISFSEVGIAFSVGALVHVATSRRPIMSRLYVPLVPLTLFALWWLGWGHTAPSDLSVRNIATAPRYVLDEIGFAIGALVGITSSDDQVPGAVGQEWPPVLFVAALALAAWRLRRVDKVPRGLWVVLAIGLTFWLLAAFNKNVFRTPSNGRYLYPGAVFVVLIASELLRGVKLDRRALLGVAAVTAMALAANLVFLSDSYRVFWKPGNQGSRADLRALEIAGPTNPSFVKGPAPFNFEIQAAAFQAAVDDWGSPAYSDSELILSPESARAEADKTLGAMLGLKLESGGPVRGPCRRLLATPSGTGVALAPGRMTLTAAGGSHATVELGRFSGTLPVEAGSVRPGSHASLAIPPDRSAQPWRLRLVGRGPVTICARGLLPTAG